MKKTRFIIIAFMLVLAMTISAFAYNTYQIYCWYSDSGSVYCWTSTPTLSRRKLDGTNDTFMSNGYSNATSEWGSVSGISFTNYGVSISNTDIKCWEGQRATLNSYFNENMSSNINGQTNYYPNPVPLYAYLSYYGATYQLGELSQARIYIVDQTQGASTYKNVYTHELGHALGWRGHSSYSTDVMYTYTSTVYVLTNQDKLHLSQVYLYV